MYQSLPRIPPGLGVEAEVVGLQKALRVQVGVAHTLVHLGVAQTIGATHYTSMLVSHMALLPVR